MKALNFPPDTRRTRASPMKKSSVVVLRGAESQKVLKTRPNACDVRPSQTIRPTRRQEPHTEKTCVDSSWCT